MKLSSTLIFIQKQLAKNKVIRYLLTRYFIYFIQFVTSFLIAIKLNIYYYGIWSFLLLIINYFQVINFGIPNSLNILMVQKKNDSHAISSFTTGAFILVFILSLLFIIFTIYYYLFGISLFNKFDIREFFYLVCFIAILFQFNTVLLTIYRVKNSLFEVAFFQSIIQILVLIVAIFFNQKTLLNMLLFSYILGNIIALSLFIKRNLVPRLCKINFTILKLIFNKGLLLFTYNVFYYLIFISNRTLISKYYSIEEFGLYAFAFNLANAIFLLADSFTFILFPKLIEKLYTPDKMEVNKNIDYIRRNYLTFLQCIVYVSLIILTIVLEFLPQYRSSFVSLGFISIAFILSSNIIGYNFFLMANNKDKQLALSSFISLLINILGGLIIIKYIHTSYEYVLFSVFISYIILSVLLYYFSKKFLNEKFNCVHLINNLFPIQQVFPLLLTFFIVSFELKTLIFIPALIFMFLNRSRILDIYRTILRIINNPNLIDIVNQ